MQAKNYWLSLIDKYGPNIVYDVHRAGYTFCCKCKRKLPVKYFGLHSNRSNGLQSNCKECNNKRKIEK